MAAPEYVPLSKAERARVYASPPWRDTVWVPERPGELEGGQPLGPGLGRPGPDQGFAMRLARRFEGKLSLAPDEHIDDVLAGACAIALRRAAGYGRAPVVHDLSVAFGLFGFLADSAPPDPELVEFRRQLFEGCADLHHYTQLQSLVDLPHDDALRLTPEAVRERAPADWRSFFALDA